MPEEISAKIAGQELSVKTMHLNTLATVFTLVAVVLLIYIGLTHSQEAKEVGQQFGAAVREQTVAIREMSQSTKEQNCILTIPQDRRADAAEFCKRVTR